MSLLRKTLIYISVLVIMLQCHSLLSHVIPNRYFILITPILLMALILTEGSVKVSHEKIYLMLIYVCTLSILVVFGDFKEIEFILSTILTFVLFMIIFSNGKYLEMIFEAFTNLMFVICIISLIFFIFGSCLNIIQPTAYYPYSVVGWGTQNYYDYYHLYCEGQMIQLLGYSGIRNTALYVEGPMLVYPIILTLYYELFLRKEGFRKVILLVYVITLITSFSSTGLFMLLVIICLKIYLITQDKKLIKYFLVPVICLTAFALSIQLFQDKSVNGAVSVGIRTDDILASLKCFINNPVFGVGFENNRGLDPFRLLWRNNAGLSSGIGGILAFGGLLWGGWHIIPIFVAIKCFVLNKQSRAKMAFIIVANILLMVTVVQSRILCTMMNAFIWTLILDNKQVLNGFHKKKKKRILKF